MGSQHTPTAENATLLQGFEWNVPADGNHWKRLLSKIDTLKSVGIDNIWLPPGCKASSSEGNGYDIYDLYDLGEFEQKGSRRTKWGGKEELMELAKKAKDVGVGLYWDAVLNHKAGADHKEKCQAVEVDSEDHEKAVTDPYEIDAWLGFDFPGRGDAYSSQKYHWDHFTGTDYNGANEKTAIYRILGDDKHWSHTVPKNEDYMMFADVDFHHKECSDDVKNWGVWITKELGLKGFRLDAVQHYSETFTDHWVSFVRQECGDDIFMVGEYWVGETSTLKEWLDSMGPKFHLFDSPLLYNFSQISTSENADLRQVLDNSLVQEAPMNAVTCVMNHDTQPGQTMETPIEGFFKPLAYSLILLRQDGYPCVFYGDLYGIGGEHPEPPSCGGKLPDLILARKLYGYGEQNDYFDEENCIGWVRQGTSDRPNGLACVMSNAGPGERKMLVGNEHAGEVWTDLLGWQPDEVTIDEEGWGLFKCPGISISVWVSKSAEGRDRFPAKFDSDIYKDG
ncbi:putative alpha-amylase [Eremomyces bilateralis CBS 781.70]|uniref:Alpha-amylase n=1 Tax=Eremomyces bilateralis CBS 781.70 TaxID=1392243 RepID=A0A6G1FY77_9PEZI|nr:putative alpha-amylase [Eremomyces bilateralis CBS 781.70]KAF1810718.1 putative alpha-amylase [Eremomyces bilateralis CBS 781.70]